MRILRRELDKAFADFPETDLRFILNGINGPQGGIAGMLLKPWDERRRSAIHSSRWCRLELTARLRASMRSPNLPPLPGGPGDLPVQMVISSTNGFQAVYRAMVKLRTPRARADCLSSSDSDLDFNQPGGADQDRPRQGHDIDLTPCRASVTRWRRCSVETTSTGLTSRGAVVPGDPAGAARQAVSRKSSANMYCARRATGRQVPLSTLVSIDTGTDPNALTHYNQFNSATFQAVPMPV